MSLVSDQIEARAGDVVACPACRVPLPAVPEVPRIDSRTLLEGCRELVIEHRGSEYHLRVTRSDKLILTK